jgi:bifunctional DNase/RNase
MLIEMTVKGVILDPTTNTPVVLLRDVADERILPIWVGGAEANAIATQIENLAPSRPMTHDLLRNVIEGLNAAVEKVVVSDLKEATFYAVIFLLVGAVEPVTIDARPSDAIALALRTKAPIFVEESVIDRAKSSDIATERAESDRLQKWLEGLDPDELGKYKM